MILNNDDILKLEKYNRINFINHLAGVKGAHLIGTRSDSGIANLAIFNSVCHIGANPPAMGFLLRPLTVERHTYDNIISNKQYTINHFNANQIKDAHQSSAKYPADVSEFDYLNFTEEYINDFHAPVIKESHISIGLTYVEKHEISFNGTVFMVGKIEFVRIADELLEDTGHINYDETNSVAVAGLDSYYSVSRLQREPYARVPK
jgi:flavin reductase (DIM6/NTAB) family NADH-FMN oxidoreductase RutF